MHHDERAVPPVRPVEGIGKTEIEGAVPAAVRIELLGRHRIEALGRLPVALSHLRAEPPRPEADRIGGEADEASVLLDPKLELRLELEDAHHHRHAELHAVRGKPLIEAGQVGRPGQRLA